jgi:hypothetical protein
MPPQSFFSARLSDSHQSAPVTLVRLGSSPPASQPEVTARRSTRNAAKSASDNEHAVQVTVDSQELSLVSQPANPILMLDQDQVKSVLDQDQEPILRLPNLEL